MQARIQASLRMAAAGRPDTQRIGQFLATFNSADDNLFFNYAIPDDGATPSAGDVEALIQMFRQHERVPRLEYIADLAPAVEAVLLAAGFSVEGRLPLMLCRPGQIQRLPPPGGVTLLAATGDEDLHAMLSAQSEAYGGDGVVDQEAVTHLREAAAGGAIVVVARDADTGAALGGGVCTAPQDGLSEIAGIGVRPAFRRRGIAGALTARLLDEAFAAGVTLAFLMAAGEAEARTYARAGFEHIGEILHISRT